MPLIECERQLIDEYDKHAGFATSGDMINFDEIRLTYGFTLTIPLRHRPRTLPMHAACSALTVLNVPYSPMI
jgi:hypothetical protein